MSWRTFAFSLVALGLWALTSAGCSGAAPTPMPTPTPTAIDGWTGVVETAAPGAKFAYYFRRDNGDRYGITSRDDLMKMQIEAMCKSNRGVRISGELLSAADVESRQIVVTRLDPLSSG